MKNSSENLSPMGKLKLLIVDDETAYLKVLEKVFRKTYEVKISSSGEEGLKVLKSGFDPGVIFADQKMPGMTGSQFLRKSTEYVPNAIRIIISGKSESSEIVKNLSECKAFMFITKPSTKLELFQVAKVAFNHYNDIKKTKYLNRSNAELKMLKNEFDTELIFLNNEIDRKSKDLTVNRDKLAKLKFEIQNFSKEKSQFIRAFEEKNATIASLKKAVDENKEYPNQSIMALSGLTREMERFFFTNNTTFVTEVALAFAHEMEIPHEKITSLSTAALLHNITLLSMPDKLKVTNPNELNNRDRSLYFKFFNRSINILNNVSLLKPQAEIISQIWEHYDGSGYPQGLRSDQFSIEAQIIALANFYHHMVYKVPKDKLIDFFNRHEVTQSPDETMARHNNAINLFFKKAKWFDMDVLNTFHDMIKFRTCKSLIPDDSTFKIKSYEPIVYHESDLEAKSDVEPVFDISAAEVEDEDELKGEKGEKVFDVINNPNMNIPSENELESSLIEHSPPKEEWEETTLEAVDLKKGMKTLNTILTVNGIKVVQNDVELDNSQVRKINQLAQSGMIDNQFKVLVKVESI